MKWAISQSLYDLMTPAMKQWINTCSPWGGMTLFEVLENENLSRQLIEVAELLKEKFPLPDVNQATGEPPTRHEDFTSGKIHWGDGVAPSEVEIARLRKWLLESQEKLRTARYDKQEVETKLQAELDKVKAELKRETENHNNNTFELLKEERRKVTSCLQQFAVFTPGGRLLTATLAPDAGTASNRYLEARGRQHLGLPDGYTVREVNLSWNDQVWAGTLQPKRPRFHLEERLGIWAIYDMEHPEYQDAPGCHADYPYVVASWSGERVDDEEGHLHHWEMPEWKQRKAKRLLAILNGGEE